MLAIERGERKSCQRKKRATNGSAHRGGSHRGATAQRGGETARSPDFAPRPQPGRSQPDSQGEGIGPFRARSRASAPTKAGGQRSADRRQKNAEAELERRRAEDGEPRQCVPEQIVTCPSGKVDDKLDAGSSLLCSRSNLGFSR